ncbi:MAG: isocitrate lyase and phosphorylmutase [Ilumatobacteraceae bacterium]|nr:isocitrate lyase and phosphorylmutase [Ilumatobacteraceae bacterium]
MVGPAATLRAAIGDGLVRAPGCADPLAALLIQQAGFPAAYLSGFALSATLLGVPDLGLISLDDIAGAVRRITAAVTIPVIADIDTGFGGPLNVRRTVVEVEAAGAAAVQIEDQLSPKRCGHFEDKVIFDIDEAVARVRVAAEARRSSDTVLVARTDAVAVEGIDAAIERARRFRDVGADVLFVEALETVEQLERVSEALDGAPLLYNAVEGGRSPLIAADVLAEHGVRILIHPVTLLLESIRAQQVALAALREGGAATDQSIMLARDVIAADAAMAFHAGATTLP